jgi:hypothetical protein
MRCPECSTDAAEGAAFCPTCDHILDASFLGDDVTAEEASGAGRSDTAPHAVPAGNAAHRAPPATGARPVVPAAAGSQATGVREVTATNALPAPPDFDRMVRDAWGWLFRLPGPDRSAASAALSLFVLSFFPWVYVPKEGSLSGVQVGGWISVFGAIAIVTLVWMRNSYALGVGTVWVQLAAATGAVLFCAYRAIDPGSVLVDVSAMGGPVEIEFHARFWLYVALIAAIVAAVASWVSLGAPGTDGAAGDGAPPVVAQDSRGNAHGR